MPLTFGRLHRRLHRLAHGAAEADAGRQLLGDTLGDELRVGFGVLDLEDVELDLLARQLLEVAADAVCLGAAAANDDAGARRVNVDADAVARSLDVDLRDAGALHALRHQLADLDVFTDVVGIGLVGIPTGLPVGRDSEAEAMRIYFLTHYRAPSVRLSTTIVMWQVRLRMR